MEEVPPQNEVLKSSHLEERMWNIFQNILMFLSLAFFAGSLTMLWTSLVDFWFPNVSTPYFSSLYVFNYTISTIVVTAPLFIYLFLATNFKYLLVPELKLSKSKKILTYIALIVTFIVLINRTIEVLNSALNDSTTINSLLKILVTMLISGSIFCYYIYDVRSVKKLMPRSFHIVIAIVISVLAIISVVLGFLYRTEVRGQLTTERERTQYTDPPRKELVAPTSQSTLAEATNTPTTPKSVVGLNFSVVNARIIERNSYEYLELELVMSAENDCASSTGKSCVVNNAGFRATDKDGFLLGRDLMTDPSVIRSTELRPGEKIKGNMYFLVDEVGDRFNVIYNTSSGLESEAVVLIMKTVD